MGTEEGDMQCKKFKGNHSEENEMVFEQSNKCQATLVYIGVCQGP